MASIMLLACNSPIAKPALDDPDENEVTTHGLGYYGEHDIELVKAADGSIEADSVYYTIPKFSFTNQDGKNVSFRDYEGKIFVSDFFFTTCKSICPAMSSQMTRLQGLVMKEGLQDKVMFLSHSVKPEEDSPEVLKAYGDALGADFSNWNFVTGKADDIYELAQEGYMLTAFPSDTAEGGVFHTDKFTLIDTGMHIRGYYDGTATNSVDKLFEDIKWLVKEKQ